MRCRVRACAYVRARVCACVYIYIYARAEIRFFYSKRFVKIPGFVYLLENRVLRAAERASVRRTEWVLKYKKKKNVSSKHAFKKENLFQQQVVRNNLIAAVKFGPRPRSGFFGGIITS